MGSIYLKKKLQSSIFKLMFEPFFILLGNLEMANNFSLKFLPFKLKTAEILEINNLPYLDFSNSVFDPPLCGPFSKFYKNWYVYFYIIHCVMHM